MIEKAFGDKLFVGLKEDGQVFIRITNKRYLLSNTIARGIALAILKFLDKDITLEGWQGKDKVTFEKEDAVWTVTEHRKDKETGEVNEGTHRISQEAVDIIWKIIRDLPEDKINYRSVVTNVIRCWGLDVDIDAFNGGYNRAKHYFPKYYYPVKILEHLKKIVYSGRGKITLTEIVGGIQNE